jgi:hypothetical protein
MGVGRSGRIVIEVEPDVKRLLYATLAKDGLTLKEWFLKSADSYMSAGAQIPLPLTLNEPEAQYLVGTKSDKKPTQS